MLGLPTGSPPAPSQTPRVVGPPIGGVRMAASNRPGEPGDGSSSVPQPDDQGARQMIFWSSLLVAVIGLLYAVMLAIAAALGSLALPPPEPVASLAALDTITTAVLLVVLVVGIDSIAPAQRRPFSRLGVVFTAMFAVAVTINRFVQLTIVRQSVAANDVADLRRFLPYDPRSVMFALEILGWGFFLGLASVSLALALRGLTRHTWIARLFGLYGVLGLTSALGLVLDSQVASVGFVAWGVILPIGAGLLAVATRPGSPGLRWDDDPTIRPS
jgi:hypothetical protein